MNRERKKERKRHKQRKRIRKKERKKERKKDCIVHGVLEAAPKAKLNKDCQ